MPTKAVTKTPYELWIGRKPILKHFHIWGCPSKARHYRPNEKKLEPRIVGSYFVGYSERSRGYKFYDPKLKIIFEMRIATFFEDIKFGGRNKVRDFIFEEESVLIPEPILPVAIDIANSGHQQDIIILPPIQDEEIVHEEQTQHPQEQVVQEPMPLR